MLKSGHLQTILGSFGRSRKILDSTQKIISLPDGDQLCCEISQSNEWKRSDPTIVMVHGLGGSYKSLYLQRLVPRLLNAGYRTVRVNLRGCGSGQGLARLSYHGGNSRDVLRVVRSLKSEFPHSNISLIGFSLGGNIILKLVGELGSAAQPLISHAIGVCPAIDLMNSAQLIKQKKNRVYQKYFMKSLCAQVKLHHHHFPDLPPIQIHQKMDLIEFDEKYTSVIWGFKGASDYYEQSSSKYHLSDIQIPCDILYARNDPVIDHRAISDASWSDTTTLWCANTGGHMGFLSWSGRDYGLRWMDYQIMNIIQYNASYTQTS